MCFDGFAYVSVTISSLSYLHLDLADAGKTHSGIFLTGYSNVWTIPYFNPANGTPNSTVPVWSELRVSRIRYISIALSRCLVEGLYKTLSRISNPFYLQFSHFYRASVTASHMYILSLLIFFAINSQLWEIFIRSNLPKRNLIDTFIWNRPYTSSFILFHHPSVVHEVHLTPIGKCNSHGNGDGVSDGRPMQIPMGHITGVVHVTFDGRFLYRKKGTSI